MRTSHRIPAKKAKLPPKRRVKGWCSSGGSRLVMLTSRAFAYLNKVGSLCREDAENVSKLQKRWWIRCPSCNKRLHPKTRLLGSEREFYAFVVPEHKEK